MRAKPQRIDDRVHHHGCRNLRIPHTTVHGVRRTGISYHGVEQPFFEPTESIAAVNAVRWTSRNDSLKRQLCNILHVCDADGIPRESPQLSDVKLAMGVVGMGVDKHVQQHCCSQSVHAIERAFFR